MDEENLGIKEELLSDDEFTDDLSKAAIKAIENAGFN
jgi:hypothetical protein